MHCDLYRIGVLQTKSFQLRMLDFIFKIITMGTLYRVPEVSGNSILYALFSIANGSPANQIIPVEDVTPCDLSLTHI